MESHLLGSNMVIDQKKFQKVAFEQKKLFSTKQGASFEQ